jgi:hypothetical protein
MVGSLRAVVLDSDERSKGELSRFTQQIRRQS